VIVAVRVAGPSGRLSDWSDFRALHVVRPLPAPADLAAENAPEGVRLLWRWPDDRPARFRVFRRQAEQETVTRLGETDRTEFTDAAVEYGVRYRYQVQAVVRAGDDLPESELSAAASITPEDRFPPPVPSGLTAAVAPESVELSWERGSEEPGLTYRVWRAEDGGPAELIAAGLATPSYSDRKASGGKRYTYAVSAVDRLGNESEKSPPVEVVLP
jgi:fibronectin type 3 domain-containing protein